MKSFSQLMEGIRFDQQPFSGVLQHPANFSVIGYERMPCLMVDEGRICNGDEAMGLSGMDKKRAKNRMWNRFEDARLFHGVQIYGTNAWSLVAQYVGNGRTRSQCSQRWSRGIDPSISRNKWTKAEMDKLMSLVAKYGDNNWVKIASEMGQRCDVQCRYRYKQIVKSRSKVELPPISLILNEATYGGLQPMSSICDLTSGAKGAVMQSSDIR